MLTTEQMFYFKIKYQVWGLQRSLLDWYISALCVGGVLMMASAKAFCPECILFLGYIIIISTDTENFWDGFGFFC